VTVTLTDGRCADHAVQSHRGDFRHPFAEQEIRDKFRSLAGEVLTAEGVAEMERAIDRCTDWASAGVLVQALRRHSGPDGY
jgi:hypothetical protein